jgi:hypothetical protein
MRDCSYSSVINSERAPPGKSRARWRT